jgi:putative transposase
MEAQVPASYGQVYVHLVWACWNRLPLLTEEIRQKVFACIAANAEEVGCQVIEIGGIEDHVHFLVRIPLTTSIADLAHDVKGASSHLVTHKLAPELGFKWQGSYGAFSVSGYHVHKVANYIRNQAAHHAENTTIPQFERCSIDPISHDR